MKTRLGSIDVELAVDGVAVGLAVATGVTVAPAGPEQEAARAAALEAAQVAPADEARVAAVRNLLRHGSYKPTGRGKPASEYLLNAAREGRFPRINNLVDALNVVSLQHLLPISLVDLDKVGASAFVVRRGRAGEAFVFNAAGQTIEVTDLLSTAALPEDAALANPVKDSMRSKLGDSATRVLAVVYAPAALARVAERAAEDLGHAFSAYGGALSALHTAIVRSAV